MATRSRKRGRRGPPASAGRAGAPAAAAPPRAPETEPAPHPGSTSPQAGPHPSRSEARNAAVRATLTPLAPGERPWALKIATLIAVLIGASDLVVVIINGSFRVGSAHTAPGGVVLFSVLMLVCAWGMWRQRYWAVLGFQAILVFVILIFSLLLLRANNVVAVLGSLLIVCGGGWLFYKLVRVLSRLQMPERPGA